MSKINTGTVYTMFEGVNLVTASLEYDYADDVASTVVQAPEDKLRALFDKLEELNTHINSVNQSLADNDVTAYDEGRQDMIDMGYEVNEVFKELYE